MSQNTQDFLAKVNMLKTAFPNMTDGELASLARCLWVHDGA